MCPERRFLGRGRGGEQASPLHDQGLPQEERNKKSPGARALDCEHPGDRHPRASKNIVGPAVRSVRGTPGHRRLARCAPRADQSPAHRQAAADFEPLPHGRGADHGRGTPFQPPVGRWSIEIGMMVAIRQPPASRTKPIRQRESTGLSNSRVLISAR